MRAFWLALLALVGAFAQVDAQLEQADNNSNGDAALGGLASMLANSRQTPTTTTTNVPTRQAEFQWMRPVLGAACHYNNQTYLVGQSWNDDCLQKCECVLGQEGQAISACRDRCPKYNDFQPGERCQLKRSKLDQCCLEWVCDDQWRPTTTTTTTGAAMTTTTSSNINNEAGELNLTTTNIPMPTSFRSSPDIIQQQQPSSPAATQQPTSTTTTTTTAGTTSTTAAATTTTTTMAATTTTTTTPAVASTRPPPTTVRAATFAPRQTTTSQQQVPTTLAATTTTTGVRARALPPTTLMTTMAATTTTTPAPTSSSRKPKQVTTGSLQPRTTGGSNTRTSGNNRPPLGEPFASGLSTRAMRDEQEVAPGNSLSSSSASSVSTSQQDDGAEVDPNKEDLCIVNNKEAYTLGQDWVEDGCPIRCRCAYSSEPRDSRYARILPTANYKLPNPERTEIRCELTPQCQANLMRQVNECKPAPMLVSLAGPQENRCDCPKATCGSTPSQPATTTRQVQTTQTTQTQKPAQTTTTTTTTASPSGCYSETGERWLAVGETFNDECHSECWCGANGSIQCKPKVCPQHKPADKSCDEWQLDTSREFRPRPAENQCCPEFVCRVPKTQPAAEAEVVVSPADCDLFGKRVAHGALVPDQIQPRTGDDCDKVCTCNNGQVECAQSPCPPLGDLPPLEFSCNPGELPVKAARADGCCPRWECQEPLNYTLQSFSVEPLNGSQAEVSFAIPARTVGLRGRALLNYTSQPANLWPSDEPPTNARWLQKPNIRTSSQIFDQESIKYTLNSLNPGHKYWFKLTVFFEVEDLANMPLESEMVMIVTPKQEQTPQAKSTVADIITTTRPAIVIITPVTTTAAATTTTTTTTTTAPPATVVSSSTPPPASTDQQPSEAPATQADPTITSAVPSSTSTSTSTPPATSSSSTTTTTTTSKPQQTADTRDIIKPGVGDEVSPCSHQPPFDNQPFDSRAGNSLPLTTQFNEHLTGYVQKYAWSLLLALCVMTLLFIIMSFLYLKKTTHVIAPITSQSAYDNPSFTKLVSYYANKPHVLLVDETGQNYNNDAILAKQKNLEVDQSSPLHHHLHQVGDIHHHNGRQHLI